MRSLFLLPFKTIIETIFFEFPRGVGVTHSQVLIPYSNVGFVSAHFLLVSASFLLSVSPLFLLSKTSLFSSSSTKKEAQKHTTDYYSSHFERERPFIIHLLRTKRTKMMKFSHFSFFASMLFFHQARVNVVQAAPAMMFSLLLPLVVITLKKKKKKQQHSHRYLRNHPRKQKTTSSSTPDEYKTSEWF